MYKLRTLSVEKVRSKDDTLAPQKMADIEDPEEMQDYMNVGPTVGSLPPMYVNSAAVQKENQLPEKSSKRKTSDSSQGGLKSLKPVITVTLSEGYTREGEKAGGDSKEDAKKQVWTLTQFFSVSFLEKIIDLPGGQINDPIWGKHYSL